MFYHHGANSTSYNNQSDGESGILSQGEDYSSQVNGSG